MSARACRISRTPANTRRLRPTAAGSLPVEAAVHDTARQARAVRDKDAVADGPGVDDCSDREGVLEGERVFTWSAALHILRVRRAAMFTYRLSESGALARLRAGRGVGL